MTKKMPQKNSEHPSYAHDGNHPAGSPDGQSKKSDIPIQHESIMMEVETLRALLRQKDALLRETNHRIKNNLQLVNSFLYLQSQTIQDEKAVAALQASHRRIRSIALSHELLSQAPSSALLDVRLYIERLATSLARVYEDGSQRTVDLRLAVADLPLTARQAITCGLIINELVSNAFEHAFPADWPASPDFAGEIMVALEPAARDSYLLEVRDNGVGMSSGREAREVPTLGKILIESFVEQLDGRGVWERNDDGGTTFRMTAPLGETRAAGTGI